MERTTLRGVRKMRILSVAFLLGCLLVIIPGTSQAVPALQVYIDGATYDTVSETWILETDSPFDVWVIGDVGHYGTILDVKLAAAVLTSEVSGGSISLTPTTTSLVTDPSTPVSPTPTANYPSPDGAIPVRGDGSLLPTHGIYGSGISFFEWELGDFTLTDSPVGDFIDSFPTDFPDLGQINVYTVAVSGFSTIHFDTYDHIYDGDTHGEYVFAPFSHDGTVPEPATFLLLGISLVALEMVRRSTRRRRY